jgi:DNA-directed RNA polymerase specialized sigma24 family protein
MVLATNLHTFVIDSFSRVRGHEELILRGVVQALRPAIRQGFEIQQLKEDSVKGTGRMTGFSVTAAKSRLCRPRAALSKSFGELTNGEFFRQRQAHVHVSWR